jgi:Cdc6-like AAA superfamily ATPase
MNLEPPFNIGIYGKPKSGKSYLIEYITSSICDKFGMIIVISGTMFNGKYDYVKKLCKKVYLTTPVNISEKLDKIMKKQRELIENYGTSSDILIIMDDIQGLFKHSAVAVSLNACYRHYRTSLIFGMQNIMSLHKDHRINHSHAIVFNMTSKGEIYSLKESFIYDLDNKDLKKYLLEGFNVPYRFLYINRETEERKFLLAPSKIYK